MVTSFVVFGSIWLSLACAFPVWWQTVCNGNRFGKWPRRFWTLGGLLALAHVAAALVLVHGGSHAQAVAHTAEQTRRLTGVPFGGGIYFNYAFVLVWAGDIVWWWSVPRGYACRPVWVARLIHGFLLFIAFQGGVVFAASPMRYVGLAAAAALGAAWFTRIVRRAAPD